MLGWLLVARRSNQPNELQQISRVKDPTRETGGRAIDTLITGVKGAYLRRQISSFKPMEESRIVLFIPIL